MQFNGRRKEFSALSPELKFCLFLLISGGILGKYLNVLELELPRQECGNNLFTFS